MKNYNKLLLALVFCVINNTYSKDVMRGAPIPTLKGSEFSNFSRGYDGFVINNQGQVDPIWVGGAFFALMGDGIYSKKISDIAWLLWNEMEGLADTFSEENQRVKAAVEQSFDSAFNELLDRPATAKVVKTRPATMPVAITVASKTLPATRTSRTVAIRPSMPPVQVSARTSFIDKSIMRGMKFTEITNDWLREAMSVALNGSMLTSSNKNTIQQAMIKIAEEAILPSVQTRGLDVNDVRGKIQSIVAQFMMNQGARF